MDQTSGQESAAILTDHATWFRYRASTDGGSVHQLGSAVLAASPGKPGINLLLSPDAEAEDAEKLLDLGMKLAMKQNPGGAFRCWSSFADVPRTWLSIILGRGLAWIWQPQWMSLPLSQRFAVDAPPGVTIVPADDACPPMLDDVPYRDDQWHARQGRSGNVEVRCFVAVADDNVVGVVTLFIHERDGVTRASLFDVGVSPRWRRSGVGRALTCTALNAILDAGARTATLNATPDGALLYTSMGFRDLGAGCTWWLPEDARHHVPTDETERELVNAIAHNDSESVLALSSSAIRRGEQQLACQMTAMQLAARCHSKKAARALQQRGVQLDVLSASRLGFHDDVPALIAALGSGIDRLDTKSGTTLLHEAVAARDVALVRALLAAGASVEVHDRHHQMTAAQWVPYVGCPGLHDVFKTAGFDQ